jgi:hypothetical protein
VTDHPACRDHGLPWTVATDGEHAGRVTCPAGCEMTAPLPPSPVGPISQGAAMNHELVLTYQAAGFSRTEAMQVLLCIIQAGIMKGSG